MEYVVLCRFKLQGKSNIKTTSKTKNNKFKKKQKMKTKLRVSKWVAASIVAAAFTGAVAQTTDFKPTINVFASGFGDYYVKTKADSSGRGAGNVTYKGVPANQSSFASRRAYLGADFTFSNNLSGQIVLANELQSGGYGVDASGNNVTYVKYAYAKWTNIFPKSNLLIGQIPTPSFSVFANTDESWGYRSIERTLLDQHNIDASTDFGVALQGKIY